MLKATLLSAACLSLIIHLFGGVLAAFVVLHGGGSGGAGPGSGGGPIEVAILTEAELGSIEGAFGLDEALASPSAPDIDASDAPAIELSESPSTTLGASSLIDADLGDAGGSLGAGDIGLGDGDLGGGGGGGGGASFFGVEARGNRIAYVVDTSGSMGLSGKLGSLQRELVKSVSDLSDNTRFLICLFSSDAMPLGGRREWSEASPSGKRWARDEIARIVADGGTEPLNGFRIVLESRPKPDAIYFMTDGEFNSIVAVEVARLNADLKVPIHCIAFQTSASEELMRLIAAESGGTYTFIGGDPP